MIKESIEGLFCKTISKFSSLAMQKLASDPEGLKGLAHFPCYIFALLSDVDSVVGHKGVEACARLTNWMYVNSLEIIAGPSSYLGHLIGHGEGSLFYILKKLGWATSLSAGESDWSCDFLSLPSLLISRMLAKEILSQKKQSPWSSI
ncbi:insulysin [Salvia divinorum]|uniref:Insulysin n=1 Tax=Salvia divinorum TaxID=28513 RepID=A0ABD1H130_SALDI